MKPSRVLFGFPVNAENTMKYTTIEKEVALCSQGVDYLEFIKVDNGDKLMVDIKTDTYKNQGHCRLSVWDASSKWNVVATRSPMAMSTPCNCYCPDAKTRDHSSDFKADRQWLLKIYEAIVK